MSAPSLPDRAALIAALEFQVAAGVDLALDEAPHDWFSERPEASETAAPIAARPVAPLARPAVRSPVPPAIARAATAPVETIVADARSLAAGARTLEDLRALLEAFEGCTLKGSARQLVFADGKPGAPVMLIGEAPGAEEDRTGTPFVGRAGQLLDRMLAAIGLDRIAVYIANVVPWRPPGNRTPTPGEVAICLPFCLRQIELAAPAILVTLGEAATQTVLGTADGINRTRGRWYDRTIGAHALRVLPTLHPAHLLRQPLHKRLAWRDLLLLRRGLGENSRPETVRTAEGFVAGLFRPRPEDRPMRWEDLRSSDNVEDRRGDGGMGGGMGGGGGGGFGFPIPGGRGGLGIGTIIVLGLVGWALGIDPRILISGAEIFTGGGGGSGYEQQAPRQPQSQPQARRSGPPADQLGRFASAILGNTEDVWKEVLPAQANRQYTPTQLVLYTRGTRSGCGVAQSAMGPFYCPVDKKVYLDVSFFGEMQRKFGATGDFAYAYVIAHEVGHHVQDVLGILGKAQARQQDVGERDGNQISVRIELMADCLAGVWAKNSNDRFKDIDESDVRNAINAAQAIGDDRLQQRSQGEVIPDSFTHGSSEQRVRWLTTGFRSGQIQSCDTFRASRL